ncbi:MAG: DUF5916 domain-containing protein, partial [Armatimonadaceae bacterium]
SRVDGFTDRQTARLAPDQTEAWLAYDDKAIYVAFRCKDSQPAGIVGRETLRDSRYQNDDSQGTEDSVEVSFDPFLSFKGDDFARFSVNPIGTRSARIGGGRAGKAEWNGEWDAAAKVGADGWTAEMRIPWSTLNFPSGGKALTIGLNIRRFQYRTRIESQWSYTGLQDFDEQEGRWSGVEPPRGAFRPTLSILPYLLPRADSSGIHERSGFDVRYTATPDLTLVASANPDFATVEGAVQNIAFSRSEQFVPERRPFFLEGGDYFEAGSFYSIGPLFYSNRIGTFDVGAKAFGKITPRDTVGVLATANFGNRADTVVRYRRDVSPTDQIGFYANRTDNPVENDHSGIFAFLGRLRQDKLGYGWQAIGSSGTKGGGSASQAYLDYYGGNLFSSVQFLDVSPDFYNPHGLTWFTNFRGLRGFTNYNKEWRTGTWRSVDFYMVPALTWRYDGKPFQRGAEFGTAVETRSDWRIGLGGQYSAFEDQLDRTVGMEITSGATNRFRQFGMEYRLGTQGGAAFRSFGPKASVRVGNRLDIIYNAGLQQWRGWTRQQILTANYLLSRTRTIGGRVVVQNTPGEKSAVNGYISYRNAGEAGTEVYLLIGDPNARTFRSLTMLKFIFAV